VLITHHQHKNDLISTFVTNNTSTFDKTNTLSKMFSLCPLQQNI